MAVAKERIAQHIEKGHSFARATVMEPVRDRQPCLSARLSPAVSFDR
jgi:hypothetical protein